MRFRRPGSTQQDLFGQLEHARQMSEKTTPLDKLSDAIDFEIFRDLLLDLLGYRDRLDKGGNSPFDPVFMLKIIVLQKFYGLSEERTEFDIMDRFSFMRFLKVAPGDKLPDKNTIWDFKEKLGLEGVSQLFDYLDEKLLEQGILGKEGVSVDASFVDVPKQRNSRKENAAIKNGEVPEGWDEDHSRRQCQKDLDARWAKKNNEIHYGYKNHVKSDNATKLIRRWLVGAANEHDSQCLTDLLSCDDGSIHADSAYRSKAIMAELRRLKIKAQICQKGQKDKPLPPAQKQANRKKSRIRARVEHIFGAQAHMNAEFIRTIGIFRAARGIGLGNFVYNLTRSSHLGVNLG